MTYWLDTIQLSKCQTTGTPLKTPVTIQFRVAAKVRGEGGEGGGVPEPKGAAPLYSLAPRTSMSNVSLGEFCTMSRTSAVLMRRWSTGLAVKSPSSPVLPDPCTNTPH